jgi:hypothetical protein
MLSIIGSRPWFDQGVATLPRGRRLGWMLIGLVPVFVLLTIGFAFTIYGEIALLLALISLVGGAIVLASSDQAVAPAAPSLDDAYERWRTDDPSK